MDAKARAEKLITIFINQVASTDSDAGWHNPSQIEWCQQASQRVGGRSSKQLTATFSEESKGFSRPDDKNIMEIQYLREPHANFKLAKFYLCEVMRADQKYYFALIAIPWYQAVYKQSYTQTKAAKALGVSVDSYKHAHKKGMALLTEMIERDDRKERMVA